MGERTISWMKRRVFNLVLIFFVLGLVLLTVNDVRATSPAHNPATEDSFSVNEFSGVSNPDIWLFVALSVSTAVGIAIFTKR